MKMKKLGKLVAVLAAGDCSHGQSCIYMLVIYMIFPMRRFIEEDVLLD